MVKMGSEQMNQSIFSKQLQLSFIRSWLNLLS